MTTTTTLTTGQQQQRQVTTDTLLAAEIADDWQEWYRYAYGCLRRMMAQTGGSAATLEYDGINRPMDACRPTRSVDPDDVSNTVALAIGRYKVQRLRKPAVPPRVLRLTCVRYAARSTRRGQLAGHKWARGCGYKTPAPATRLFGATIPASAITTVCGGSLARAGVYDTVQWCDSLASPDWLVSAALECGVSL